MALRVPVLVLAAAVAASGCRAKVLESAPDLGIPTILQGSIQTVGALSELRPNVVVLEFWATWCGPCRKTLPHMNKLVEEFRGKPVRFIAVTSETPVAVREFVTENPMRSWIGIDPDGELGKAFRIRGIPQVVVIDPFGRIRVKVSTSFFYASDIEKALRADPPAEPQAPAKPG